MSLFLFLMTQRHGGSLGRVGAQCGLGTRPLPGPHPQPPPGQPSEHSGCLRAASWLPGR